MAAVATWTADRYADTEPGMRRFNELSAKAFDPNFPNLAVAEQRAIYEHYCRQVSPPRPVGVESWDEIVDLDGRGLRLRVFRRAGQGPTTGGIVYFHGGGFILGSVATHDPFTALLARETGAVVVSVDYRLAPEHPFPAAFDDAFAATGHVARTARHFGIDPARLAVAGDSAGGNLATAVSLAARDRGGPRVAYQALIYPDVGGRRDFPSCVEHANAPSLSTSDIDYYRRMYLGRAGETDNIHCHPALAADLARLPPAYILTADYDPLRGGAEDYGRRLAAAGVPTTVRRAAKLPHAFIRAVEASPTAKAEIMALARALATVVGTP
ncbi:MAG: alpha/beta hydrolase [Alphaproteobacteria bacterium]|nr:alpha/beta hydrolase [Alphaproteobacteria bacterium]